MLWNFIGQMGGIELRKTSRRFWRTSLAAVCAAVLLFTAVPLGSSVSAATTAKTTDYLNLRQGPGTNTKVILTLIKNATVTILDNSDSQWAKVKTVSGYVGYCFKQYLSFSGSQNTSSSSSGITAKTTTALNMRNGPSLGNGIITVLKTGTSLKVLDNSNRDWVKVQTSDGRSGWCYRQYLAISGAASSTSSNTSTSSSGSSLTAVTTDYLNLRTGAGLNYRVILTMKKGSTVTVLDNSNRSWVKVRTASGTQGWCSRDYLKISSSTSSSSSSSSRSSSTTTSSSSSSKASSSSSSSTSSNSSSSASSGSTGSTSTPSTPKLTGALVQVNDLLRLRSGPGTSYSVLGYLKNGTYLTVLEPPKNSWMKVKWGSTIGYVCTDYVKFLYDGDTGSSNSISISTTSAKIPQGKTLWIKASGSATWTSSNTKVATVQNGYVLAVAPGTAVITAASGSAKAVCNVTVTEAEPVRAAYASPNIAAPRSAVTFTAVTDTQRDGVRFLVTMQNGSVRTLQASLSATNTTNGVTTKVWTASTKFDTAGVYSFTAVSSVKGVYSSGGVASDVMVATQGDPEVSTNESRRATDKLLNLIAGWEGYSATVYADKLTYNSIPTIGYGFTLSSNAVFYNNLSKPEAWAQLVNTVNHGSYTTELNRMIAANNFKMNQNQADALISFAYNVGAGYFNSSQEMDFRRIMKNAVVPPEIPSSGLGAKVTYSTSMRQNHTFVSNPVCSVSNGTSVTVINVWKKKKNDIWYEVRLSDGKTGWLNAGYVNFNNSNQLEHDLNYTNATAFGSELILWNHAGGKFVAGLFYRRLNEANIYNYGDFKNDRSYLLSNPYGYTFPKSASVLTG
jgi:uncharacterized protein YgiM (DUF1202 family)